MGKGVTTRFLLGRRGAKMYPLRSPGSTTSTSTPTGSSSSSTQPLLMEEATGRHGVPPPRAGWNCKKQPQQVSYVYGFPIPPAYHSSNTTKHWLKSKFVLVTLTLLCGCFVGAYCLVLRIDRTLQQSQSLNPAVGALDTVSLRREVNAQTILQKLELQQQQQQILFLPLYINLTLFQVPCDDIHVQLLQQTNNITHSETDRLVFKNVRIDHPPETSMDMDSHSDSDPPPPPLQNSYPQQHDHGEEELKVPERSPSLHDHKLKFSSFHLQRRLEQQQQQDEPPTGCQIMGHLQLPLGLQQQQQQQDRPVIISIQAQKQPHRTLAHRIDQLRIGSVKMFPKEESLVLNHQHHPFFQPHTYIYNLLPQDTLVVHRYQIHDQFHLIEQQQQEQDTTTTTSLQHVNSHHQPHQETPEIRLVFAPPPAPPVL